jgi:hypothetical protein
LEELKKINNKSFEFVLEADGILFEQQDLEGLISSKVNDTDESIVDIGIKVDKKIYEQELFVKPFRSQKVKKAEREILESFSSITGQVSETLNSW